MELGLFTTCRREGESQVERLVGCARRSPGSPLEDAGSIPATSTPIGFVSRRTLLTANGQPSASAGGCPFWLALVECRFLMQL